ncbi:MAG: site-2 protease family protein [Desulfarculales bacterium]|nr:site-2 protease family protein [Desulfarculales bacterium]
MEIINKIILLAPAILVAMTVHEMAHAFASFKMGDDTAKLMGRVSLNPLRHLDPMGTLFFLVSAWAGMGIGWAKPVPVNYRRMKNARLGIILVSAAGPAANMLTVLALGIMTYAAVIWQWTFFFYILDFVFTIAYVNAIFAFFNLLPLPPLDGSGMVTGLLPAGAARVYQKFSRYGFLVLMVLIFLPLATQGFPDILKELVREPALNLINICFPISLSAMFR